MTAREFLKYAGYEVEEQSLYLLGQYLGRGNFFVQYPDAEVETEEGIPLENLADEPANFQEFMDRYSED